MNRHDTEPRIDLDKLLSNSEHRIGKVRSDCGVTVTNDWISDIKGIDEIVARLKELGERYISSSSIDARHLANMVYRLGVRLEQLGKDRGQ